MSRGSVYILKNASMPGMVKIGRTTGRPEDRARQLYQTGVPTPFDVDDSVFSPDCVELERRVHEALSECRVSGSREFFQVSASYASGVLDREHAQQLQEWLQDFLPDHTIVNDDLIVDPKAVADLGQHFGRQDIEIITAMAELRPEDLEPALRRWDEKVEKRRRMAKAGIRWWEAGSE